MPFSVLNRTAVFCLICAAAASPTSAAILSTPLFGGPGPSTTTDSLFVAAGNTAFESWGFEASFNTSNDARINALVPGTPNTFVFAAAGVNINPNFLSGQTYSFTQSYSGDLTRQLNISLTDGTTNWTIPQYVPAFGNVRSLIVRMVAPDPDLPFNPNNPNSARPTAGGLLFANWVLNGQPINGMPANLTLATFNNPNVDDIRLINYFAITGIDFSQPWTLSGDFTMAWSGSTSGSGSPLPGANDLAFQIKAYQLDLTTPEPSTLLLLTSALAVCLWIRTRS